MTMQMRAEVVDQVSLLGRVRSRLLGLSPAEASFAKRGFIASELTARERLEQIGVTFLSGYHAALEETNFVTLARRLTKVERDSQGFAFEGAAMGLALLDCFTPWKKDRWRTFTYGPASAHIYMMHVGLGWALARLRRRVTPHLVQLDPLIGWLVVDGYGFHEGYFGWPRYIEQQAIPARLNSYERRVFDQGLGRSLWFVKGADVESVVSTINAFPSARHHDLWSGIGLASAYAGGCDRRAIDSLQVAAGKHFPAFAQGVAFAAKTRQRAANLNAHTETICHVICRQSAAEVAAITDEALEDLPRDDELPVYEEWRRRIQNKIALEVTRTC
jgi:enediyne biosynthesis protein E3